MKQIKLLIDSHVFDGEYYQGTRTFLKGLYVSLAKIDAPLSLYIAASDVKNLELEFADTDNINFIRYSSKNKYLRLSVDIPQIIKTYKIDYAHFQYICPLIKNCRWIVTIHDLLFKAFPDEFPFTYKLKNNILFKRSAKMADLLTTDSKYSAQAIEQYYKIPHEQIHTLPIGISHSFFSSYDKQASTSYIKNKYGVSKYILYISRIEPRKNQAFLLQTFLELNLARRGYQLVFIGKRSIPSLNFELLLKSLDRETHDAVRYYETVDNQDLLEFYRAAQLFVYPSKAEGFGIPPLEAVALGIPTLCANTTAMGDFIFLKNCLFNPNDINELKGKILFMLDEQDKHKVECARMRDYVVQNYTWEKAANRFAMLILDDTINKRC